MLETPDKDKLIRLIEEGKPLFIDGNEVTIHAMLGPELSVYEDDTQGTVLYKMAGERAMDATSDFLRKVTI